jgi:quercetin dioxygenase-like cupin family protein
MNDINKKGMRYYSRDDLHFSSDVLGARQWGVALEKTMLTYFEVEPNSRFETHTHESEQITLVLEGILFFEQDDTIIEVKTGDVIAIPSNAPHAVFTKEMAAKAVDAWSPVMVKYQK